MSEQKEPKEKATGRRLIDDAEIVAMSEISEALAPLGDRARGRALRWATEKFVHDLDPDAMAPGDVISLDDH